MSKPFCHQSPAGRGGACFTQDKYIVDVYNMGTFLYESIYIGMPAMYHAIGHDGANTEGFHVRSRTPHPPFSALFDGQKLLSSAVLHRRSS